MMTETSSTTLDTPPENGAGPSGIHVVTENGEPLTINGHHDSEEFGNIEEGEVSPTSLRRSTRQANLKAQQKLTVMGILPNGIDESHPPDVENLKDFDDDSEPKAKKLKLIDGRNLDQYDCKFAVRMDDHEEVYMLTDESEIASLNSEEVGELRRNYEEFKQAGVSEEQQFERDIQVKDLETQLRLEENKLILLKKTMQNQKDAEIETHKKEKILAEAIARQQNHMNSFKPVVATNPAKVNGTTPKSSKSKQNNSARDTSQAILSVDPAAQRELLQRLMANPQLASQANNILPPQLLQLLRQQQQQNIQKANANSTSTPAQPAPKKEPPVPTTTPAQRAAEARRKLKANLDQQLLSIPAPKPIVSDINFIPSSTSDFLYLLGLDLTVQRVLKDKNVFKKYDEEPYSCEECGTDFTPAWKAIVGKENDLHLYCEKCVREAQKKKMKQDHGNLFKKAFAKVAEQEKELEKQIAAGKFDDPPAPPPQPPPKTSTPTTVKQSASSSSLHQSASAGSLNPVAAALLLQQQQQQQQQRQKQQAAQQASTSTQSTKTQSQSKASKRQASNNTSTANTNSSSANQNMFMNLFRNNPIMAAAMMGNTNPQMLQWALANGANNAAANNRSGNTNNNVGALALLQMAAAANNPSNNSNNQNLLNLFNNPLAALAMAQNPLIQNLQRLQQQQASSSSTSKSKK